MHACAEPCCADSPDSPTFAMPCHADSPDSPTFAEPCCADSPNSPTFAKPCCADSPDSRTLAKGHFREKCDSPRHICTSNSPFSRIWGRVAIAYALFNKIKLYLFFHPTELRLFQRQRVLVVDHVWVRRQQSGSQKFAFPAR
jgi:hypothetical protein